MNSYNTTKSKLSDYQIIRIICERIAFIDKKREELNTEIKAFGDKRTKADKRDKSLR